MHHERLLSAIGLSLWWTAASASQSLAPIALSEPLRALVRNERFMTVTSVKGLPLGVRDGLQSLFGSTTLDIAEPDGAFRHTDAPTVQGLPLRRLVAAGCTIEYCLVYYERGGGTHTWHVALFHWTPAATRFEWGGIAPAGLVTLDEVRKAVLSGAIRGPAQFW